MHQRGSPEAPTVPDKLGHFAQSSMSMSGPASVPQLKTPSTRKGVGSEKKQKSILGPDGGL
jgi:hypothetical protein